MERLTEISNGGIYISAKRPICGSEHAVINAEIRNKLGLYEDTGLTPDEIASDIRIFKESWEEKVKEIKKERDYWESEAKKWCDKAFEYRMKLEGGKQPCQK